MPRLDPQCGIPPLSAVCLRLYHVTLLAAFAVVMTATGQGVTLIWDFEGRVAVELPRIVRFIEVHQPVSIRRSRDHGNRHGQDAGQGWKGTNPVRSFHGFCGRC